MRWREYENCGSILITCIPLHFRILCLPTDQVHPEQGEAEDGSRGEEEGNENREEDAEDDKSTDIAQNQSIIINVVVDHSKR